MEAIRDEIPYALMAHGAIKRGGGGKGERGKVGGAVCDWFARVRVISVRGGGKGSKRGRVGGLSSFYE